MAELLSESLVRRKQKSLLEAVYVTHYDSNFDIERLSVADDIVYSVADFMHITIITISVVRHQAFFSGSEYIRLRWSRTHSQTLWFGRTRMYWNVVDE